MLRHRVSPALLPPCVPYAHWPGPLLMHYGLHPDLPRSALLPMSVRVDGRRRNAVGGSCEYRSHVARASHPDPITRVARAVSAHPRRDGADLATQRLAV